MASCLQAACASANAAAGQELNVRITGLHVERFGIWQDLQIDGLHDGVTLFYAPNEGGKTTLVQFIRAVLCGIAPGGGVHDGTEDQRASSEAGKAHDVGGSLLVSTPEGHYCLRRTADPRGPAARPGVMRLTPRDGTRSGETRLDALLRSIDEALLRQVFTVGLAELQDLGHLDGSQAAPLLYELSTGRDSVSLVEVMRHLQSVAAQLIGEPGQPSLLSDNKARQHTCQQQMARRSERVAEWVGRTAERDRVQAELKRCEQQGSVWRSRVEILTAALRVRPAWEQLQAWTLELELAGPVKEISEKGQARLQQVSQQLETLRRSLTDVKVQRSALRSQLGELTAQELTVSQASRLSFLLDQRGQMTTVEHRVQQAERAVELAELAVAEEQQRLGLLGNTSAGKKPAHWDLPALAALQEPARLVEQDRVAWEAARAQGAEHRKQADRLQKELARAMGKAPEWLENKGPQDLQQAMQQTRNATGELQRLDGLEKELRQLTRRRRGWERRRLSQLEHRLLPWTIVKALGLLFALGAGLLLSGVFGSAFDWSSALRHALLAMGAIVTGVAALLKVSLEVPSQGGESDAERQAQSLSDQWRATKREYETLRARYSAPRGKQDRLGARGTHSHLTRLEALLPLDQQRRDALASAEQAEARASQLESMWQSSRERWQELLSRWGLPEQWSPADVRALPGRTGTLAELHARLSEHERVLQRAREEQQQWMERIRELAQDLKLSWNGQQLSDGWSRLSEARQQHQQHRLHLDRLRSEYRKLQQQQRQVQTALRRQRRQQLQCLRRMGVVDELDLQRQLEHAQHVRDVSENCQQLRAELLQLSGGAARLAVVEAELHCHTAEDITQQLERAQTELQGVEERCQELTLRQTELMEEIRKLVQDDSLARAKLEYASLRHQERAIVERWQQVTSMMELLATVYKKYERERQPETLQEASDYLRRMTAGRYCRVWTPLADDRLLVDDRQGRQWPVEQLSRGTREQLCLSLHLALVSCFARRGLQMPLILDDVLVNFDTQRAAAAVEVLVEFSDQGHQILFFTCQQHLCDSFRQKAGQVACAVRRLPTPTTELVAL